ncbi:metalloregulator ArsR/SmtB family transcription factor [Ectothiorhodospiraceae bacterium 2226]|nr:metalloregulator ArsR/SmtB family transcription factor [Ectothiorhodospiraceae bacterium 2226]
MSERALKNLLYEQVARIAKAAASPKRLELLEVLCQGEKSVEQLAADAEISLKLASAHLKELRLARLVETRREGKHVFYRLLDAHVADFWVMLRVLAEERLLELQAATQSLVSRPDELSPLDGKRLLEQARRGEVVVIDVRPGAEYAAAHLPHARSLPLPELKARLGELPQDKPVVAYCRGPFCLMAKQAVELLARAGIRAGRIEDGVAEWRARGLPLEAPAIPSDRT